MRRNHWRRADAISSRLSSVVAFNFVSIWYEEPVVTSQVKKPATVVDIKTATPDSPTTAPPIPPTQVEAREEVTRTSAILQRQSLPDFSTALSWDVMTDRYNEFVKSFGKTSTLNRKKRQVNKQTGNPLLMPIQFGWQYGEDFSFNKNTHDIVFYRSSEDSFHYDFTARILSPTN